MPELDLPADTNGVLPSQLLRQAIDRGIVHAGDEPVPHDNVQPASIDLRLGDVAYRMRCSFLPGEELVEDGYKPFVIDELDLRDAGAVLETNRPYLIPLHEQLRLPPGIRAKANPKSSTGRLDVFCRVITDHSHLFDEVEPGYEGRLWLEVVPLSFTVRVRQGLSLNQLRLSVGRSEVGDDELRALHGAQPLLFDQNGAVPEARFAADDGLFLGLDLRGDDAGRVGWRARGHTRLLDMSRVDSYWPVDFWEPVEREAGDRVVLDPGTFYLLLSEQRVCVPPDLAAEMTAFDPTSGELRVHYAGFFDPGFGFDPDRPVQGSRAALEVRAHDVPFMIEHGQRVCRLRFERMAEIPDRLYGQQIGSAYQGQLDTLSKHFRRIPPAPSQRRPDGDDSQLDLGLPETPARRRF